MAANPRPGMERRVTEHRRVLVVDDEENLRHMIAVLLEEEGYRVEQAVDGSEALARLDEAPIDFVVSDLRMPRMDGMELLAALGKRTDELTFILMTAYGDLETALEAIQLGAYDYVQKPFKPEEILLRLRMAEERERLRRENVQLRRQVQREYSFDNIIGRSEPMRKIFRTIEKIGDYKTTVLINGESGTGKELFARALHVNSSRCDKPFVAVNCGAIPENLLESELFGHAKGAFTDAVRTKQGLFEEADQGTLFLDEIGELPLALQVKLLRVLQEEEVRPVGDTRTIKIDVRIVAATVRDLGQEVAEGRFREDLFYRLNVLPIRVPPLRERREDLPLLIEHFLEKYNRRLGTEVSGFSQSAMQVLLDYSWPGNVRELENTVERAAVLADGTMIDEESLPDKLRETRDPLRLTLASGELSIKKTVRVIEEELIRRALTKTGGNRTAAAKLLEISHRALLYKIKEFGIDIAPRSG